MDNRPIGELTTGLVGVVTAGVVAGVVTAGVVGGCARACS
jgi:hypothetical protein